jgi:hypothetical protein
MSATEKRYKVIDPKGIILPMGESFKEGEFLPEGFAGKAVKRLIHFKQVELTDYKAPKETEPESKDEGKATKKK